MFSYSWHAPEFRKGKRPVGTPAQDLSVRAGRVVRIHVGPAKPCQLQSREYKRIPCKYAMVSKKRMGGIGCQIFLASGEIRRSIHFRPQTVGDGVVRFAPAVQPASNIPADFNSHPAAAVVVDAIHIVIRVIGGVCRTDHWVPLVGEVAPT